MVTPARHLRLLAAVVSGAAVVHATGLAGLTGTADPAGLGVPRLSTVLAAIAVCWGAIPAILELALRRAPAPDPPAVATPSPGPDVPPALTVLVRAGDEPSELLELTVVAAAARAPVLVLASRPLPELAHLGVPVVDARAGDPLVRALAIVETPGVVVVSGRALVRHDALERAAALLDDATGWVCGRVVHGSHDGLAPVLRETAIARHRALLRASGLALWEPDATVVRTDVLARATEPGRPFGRALRATPTRGAQVDEVLAVRSTPVQHGGHWSASVLRHRGAVADAADAAATTRGRAAWLARALVLRETFAVPLALWLALPLVAAVEDAPLGLPALALYLAAASVRWVAGRREVRMPLRPFSDLLATLHAAVGSFAALPSALTARARPMGRGLPARPLIWAGLGGAVVCGATVFAGQGSASRSGVSVLVLGQLAVIWPAAVAGLLQRTWVRRDFRLDATYPVLLDDRPCEVENTSLRGLAVRTRVDAVRTGDEVRITLPGPDACSIDGRVASVRPRGDGAVAGIELAPASQAARRPWIAHVTALTTERAVADHTTERHDHDAPALPAARRSPARRVATAGAVAATALVGVVGATSLVALLLGLQPRVVRSGSMYPTIHTGDLVLSVPQPATDVRPGDVVTFLDPSGGDEWFTHRVVSVEDLGDHLTFVTRGDANAQAETWSVARDGRLPTVHHRLPVGGRVLLWASSRLTPVLAAAAGLVVVALIGRRPRPVARPPTPGPALGA